MSGTMDLDALGKEFAAQMPGAVTGYTVTRGELTLTAAAGEIVRVLKYLQENPVCAFEQLLDVCGVDRPERAKRFDVVYHLLSLSKNARIRVKVQVDEATPVPTAVEVFPTANWFERETFDMYGITFAEHPDLRRILTDYGFSGYPLRKDFPLTGYVEVHYDEELKRVVYRPVKLVQEFRDFDFISPWEGAPYILPNGGKAPGNG
jgi:NADH-quinone oxidoreductase subunit C